MAELSEDFSSGMTALAHNGVCEKCNTFFIYRWFPRHDRTESGLSRR